MNIWLLRLVLILGTYAIVCLLLALGQRKLLYLPKKLTLPQATAIFDSYGLRTWPTEPDTEYRGLMLASAETQKPFCGTLLVFHGNACNAHDMIDFCHTFSHYGWRVLLAEYPGYAARKGQPSEKSLVKDALETTRLIKQQYPGKLALCGISLGCAIAAAVATDPDLQIDQLFLATPWDKLATVAARHYPWLPITFLLADHYDSARQLRDFKGTVTMILAENDEIIPLASSMALYHALLSTRNKRIITIPQATHNNWYYLTSEKQWREIFDTE